MPQMHKLTHVTCHLTYCVYFVHMGNSWAGRNQAYQCSPCHYYMEYQDNIQNLFI